MGEKEVQGKLEVECAAGVFFFGVASFVGEHAFLCAATAAAFLTADFLDAGTLGGNVAFLFFFDLIQQEATGQKPVETLLASCLAFNLETGGAMNQHDASGGLVDVLTAMPARANEGFFDIRFAHPESGHALGKLVLLFGRDRKGAHEGKLRQRRNETERKV